MSSPEFSFPPESYSAVYVDGKSNANGVIGTPVPVRAHGTAGSSSPAQVEANASLFSCFRCAIPNKIKVFHRSKHEAKSKGKHATNLKNHLAAKHLEEFKLISDINKNIMESSTPSPNRHAIVPPSHTIEKIKRLCTRLVTVHGRPLAMMEDDAFQDLVNMAAPNEEASKSTNIKAIKNCVQKGATEIRNKIAEEVKNQLISLKLDAVTCQERKFIGINIQYIKDTKIIIRNLAVLEIFNRQTASYLKTTIEEILSDFKISIEQIYCICTDNGSNMIKMVKILGGQYCSDNTIYLENQSGNKEEEDDEVDDEEIEEEVTDQINVMNEMFTDLDIENFIINASYKPRGMLCAAHTLQLAVKDAINQCIMTQSTINLARRIVNILRKPNNANLLKVAGFKKPIKDCLTRWSSTFNMLEKLLSFEDFCTSNLEDVTSIVADVFWNEVRDLVNTLKPANKATIILQRQQLTIGDFFITWLNCKNEVKIMNNNFASALFQSMEQREVKLLQNDVILEGLYLDGRLNVVLSNEQCQKARSLLTEVLHQVRRLKETAEAEPEAIQSAVVFDAPSTSRVSDLEQMLINTERARGPRQCRSFDICLFEVLTMPRLPLTEDIIKHWNNKSFASSELAIVAKVVLAAPTTQVSVERLFSSLKFILNPLRSNLSCYSLKDIMTIRENKDLL